ncbi:hypothetical protein ACTMTI_34060 [Nonomuraea sp. H19]|uniref:hypothetical protein n=1 Tax=Nonomuraea sp. H19 TaxID=3452206 RepID=UPI003F8AD680
MLRPADLRRIPIVEPTVLPAWSVVWHRRNPRPLLQTLLRRLPSVALPPPSDPHQWVPDIDLLPVGPGHAPGSLSGAETPS